MWSLFWDGRRKLQCLLLHFPFGLCEPVLSCRMHPRRTTVSQGVALRTNIFVPNSTWSGTFWLACIQDERWVDSHIRFRMWHLIENVLWRVSMFWFALVYFEFDRMLCSVLRLEWFVLECWHGFPDYSRLCYVLWIQMQSIRRQSVRHMQGYARKWKIIPILENSCVFVGCSLRQYLGTRLRCVAATRTCL